MALLSNHTWEKTMPVARRALSKSHYLQSLCTSQSTGMLLPELMWERYIFITDFWRISQSYVFSMQYLLKKKKNSKYQKDQDPTSADYITCSREALQKMQNFFLLFSPISFLISFSFQSKYGKRHISGLELVAMELSCCYK